MVLFVFREWRLLQRMLSEERDNEIKNLKSLVDTLRARIEQLEQEQQRQTLLDKSVGSIDSYGCYS